MIFDRLFKKPETDEHRIIRWADTIVANSNYDGELNNECLDPFAAFWRDKPTTLTTALSQIRNEIISRQPQNSDGVTVNLEITKQYIQGNYDAVSDHLLNNGYINKPDHNRKWVLNEDGKKMKKLKGHNKYQNYLDKKQKAEIAELNGKIHWLRRAIIIAIASGLIGYGLRYLTEPKEKKSVDQSSTVGQSPSTPAMQLEKSDSTK